MWCSSSPLVVAVNSKQRSNSLKKSHTHNRNSDCKSCPEKVVEIGHFGIADGINDRPHEYKSSCMSQKRGSLPLVTRSSSFDTYTEKDLAILALLYIPEIYNVERKQQKRELQGKVPNMTSQFCRETLMHPRRWNIFIFVVMKFVRLNFFVDHE